jgi:hypothetical protein
MNENEPDHLKIAQRLKDVAWTVKCLKDHLHGIARKGEEEETDDYNPEVVLQLSVIRYILDVFAFVDNNQECLQRLLIADPVSKPTVGA